MIWGYPHVGKLHVSVNVYILKSKLFRMTWIELDSIHHEWSKIIISNKNKNKKHLKTYPTVDGCEILHQLKTVVYPTIYMVSTIQDGAGFRNHPQYVQANVSHVIPDPRFPSASNCQALCQGLSAPKRCLSGSFESWWVQKNNANFGWF